MQSLFHDLMNSCIAIPTILGAVLLLPRRDVRADNDSPRTAQYLLTGMKDARERLRSGIFRANGTLVDDLVKDHPLNGPVEVYCAFDFAREMLRFDRRQPIRWGDPGPELVQAPMLRFVRTPSQTVHFDENHHMVSIGGADAAPKGIRPWNVRVMGLLPESGLDKPFEKVYEFYARLSDPMIAAQDDHTYRLAWVTNHSWGDTRSSIWIDEQAGFSPVRFQMQHRPSSDQVREPDADWMEPSVVSESKWIQEGDAWVPLKYIQTSFGTKGGEERLEFTFTWESVNQPVSDELFSPASFGLPGHLRVVDQRLGRPVELGHIEDLYATAVPRTPPVTAKSSSGVMWVAGLAILGVVASVAILVFWRSRRRVGS